MKAVWEELESMSDLPCITTAAEDVTQFLACLNRQMAEHRLFQFLNGLTDAYQAQRSQILLMSPLPSVEVVCGMLQQEEQQKQNLEGMHFSSDHSVLLSKNVDAKSVDIKCSECGNKGRTTDKCWHVIGFPSWHPRARKSSPSQRRGGPTNWRGTRNFRSRGGMSSWKGAAQVELDQSTLSSQQTTLTAQQVEQLLKLLPQSSVSSCSGGTKIINS